MQILAGFTYFSHTDTQTNKHTRTHLRPLTHGRTGDVFGARERESVRLFADAVVAEPVQALQDRDHCAVQVRSITRPQHTHTHTHAQRPAESEARITLGDPTYTCTHAYMHTCIHAYMHTCVHAYMHPCVHACDSCFVPVFFSAPCLYDCDLSGEVPIERALRDFIPMGTV